MERRGKKNNKRSLSRLTKVHEVPFFLFLRKLKNKKENGESRTTAAVMVVKVNCGQGRTA